jgi:hypothetical protein
MLAWPHPRQLGAPQTVGSTPLSGPPHETALVLSCNTTCSGAVAYPRTPLQGVQLCLPLPLGLGPVPPCTSRPLDQPRPHHHERAPPRVRPDRVSAHLHVRAPPPIVRDVDVVGNTDAIMMSIAAQTSSLLTVIELVGKPLSADYTTHSTTVGVS